MKNGWANKRLGDVCEFVKEQGEWTGLPYVGLEHIESNTGVFLGSRLPQTVKSTTFRFTPEHVLYGRLRPYLNKVLLPDFVGHCSTEIFPVKPTEQLDRNYFSYWLRSDETVAKINDTWTGARMPRANMKQVLEFKIPVPPTEEQRRIVTVLDEAFAAIDKAKANTEKNIQNARELFDSYLNNIFSNPGPDWEEKQIAELCEIKHGFAFKSEFFTTTGEYVLLTPGNFLESGGYRDRGEKQKYYTGEIPQDYVLSEGDLLVAMTEQAAGLLGSPILVPGSAKFLHNQRLGLVKAKPDVPWTNDFFFHVFNMPHVRKELHASGTGVKVRHTSPTKIGDVVVSFPMSIEKQLEIVGTLRDLKDETQSLESVQRGKIIELDELKKSILQKAFSGEL